MNDASTVQAWIEKDFSRSAWTEFRWLAGRVLGAAVVFHMASWERWLAPLLLVHFALLFELMKASSPRKAFRAGFLCGFAVFAPQLGFFWGVFRWSAVALWAILAFYYGVFVLLGRETRMMRPVFRVPGWALLWMGIEYFRSELYFLKFPWVTPGLAFSGGIPSAVMSAFGVYGLGFVLCLLAGWMAHLKNRGISLAIASVALIAFTTSWQTPLARAASPGMTVAVGAVQLEMAPELEIPGHLDRLLAKHPATELVVLSEYSFDGPVHPRVREWCRKNRKYLIAGGKDPVSTNFYNTAFVIGPEGDVVFKQVKSVPIQFFKDGLPAPERKLWESPWGKLAIFICYDLGYSRVVDDFVSQGAQALIVPTMDVEEWGRYQHLLHARVSPARAAEYGVPIFRIASSGVSQLVTATGATLGATSIPGQGELLAGTLEIGRPGKLPADRYLAPGAAGFTILFAAWCLLRRWKAPTRQPTVSV